MTVYSLAVPARQGVSFIGDSYKTIAKAREAAKKWADTHSTDVVIYRDSNRGAVAVDRIKPSQRTNGVARLKRNPDRLQDAVIVVRGKKVKGKAKYDSKAKRVRIFVPPAAARKVNPELREYKVVLFSKDAPRNITVPIYATTAGNASREARKRKAEFVSGDPRKWKVLSVKRVDVR